MLLKDKTVIIHGAAGHLGRSIATTFAREGAQLFLAGRTFEPVQTLAKCLDGDAAQVDALDEMSVDEHAEHVLALAGRIDICINAVSIRGDLQGQPLIDMSVDDVLAPAETGIRTHFITARAAARRMIPKRTGVILTLSSTSAGLSGRDRVYHRTGGFGVGCTAVEALSRSLAGELGPHGIRVVCLRADALPETWPPDAEPELQDIKSYMDQGTALGRLPRLSEVADAAAFAASERAGAMTGTIINLTCGSVMDAN
ncbi:SDR family NAD(P)-dependent oxidoreductase [Rhizobium herbae]